MAWPLMEEFCFSFPVTEEIQELSRIQIGWSYRLRRWAGARPALWWLCKLR